MLWAKKSVLLREEYRLMNDVERARKKWHKLKRFRSSEKDPLESEMPYLLAEMRYRYLLRQARDRNWINRWYLDFTDY